MSLFGTDLRENEANEENRMVAWGPKYPGFVTGVNQSISMNLSMPLVATSWMKVTRGSDMGTGLGSIT